MINEDTKKETIVLLELTEEERKALGALLLGHGNGKKASQKSGVQRATLRYISLSGKGHKKNIQKIRRKLLEPIGVKENSVEIRQDTGLGNQGTKVDNALQQAS